LPASLVSTIAVALARSPGIDVFVEMIVDEEGAALSAAEAALGTGKSIVTANKALLAKHGMRLVALAEASVAGGIRVVKTLREGLAGNSIKRVYGILNGTCNYILTRMEVGGSDLRATPQRGAKARLPRDRNRQTDSQTG
jgi:homoserine dehydrogenase